MKKTGKILKLLMLLSMLVIPSMTVQGSPTDRWSSIGTGIDYQVFTNPYDHSFNIYVSRMDRNNPNVFIESAISSGSINGSWETVRQMASRNDEAINFWGSTTNQNNYWGGRNHVVVAINGDYPTDKVKQSPPLKEVVHSGWYDKRVPDSDGWSGFVWTMDRDAFVGECVINPGMNGDHGQFITYAKTMGKLPILNINNSRSDGQLVVYTPDFGSYTPNMNSQWTDNGWEVVVQMNRPAGMIPVPYPNSHNGKVITRYNNRGLNPIPFDSIVLSGNGSTGDSLRDFAQVDDIIGITQEVDSFDAANCKTNLGSAKDWTNTYASIGGGYAFLQDGKLDSSKVVETQPRTAIAMNKDYIYFVVADGLEKKPPYEGMNYEQLGTFCRDTLAATWAIDEDGGSSSVMVVNGQLKNNPDYCSDSNCTSKEKLVVNGLMMVVQEPMVQSNFFNAKDETTTRGAASLLLGPGTNYGLIKTLDPQTHVTIMDEPHGINGVLAKGTSWWKVWIPGQAGWVAQNSLKAPYEISLPSIFRN